MAMNHATRSVFLIAFVLIAVSLFAGGCGLLDDNASAPRPDNDVAERRLTPAQPFAAAMQHSVAVADTVITMATAKIDTSGAE